MNKLSLISLLFILTSLCSCKSDDDSGIASTNNDSEVNDFIWSSMNSWYFWQDDVPSLADNSFNNGKNYTNFLNSTDDHEAFFYNLLYRYGEIDRFSWIVDDVEELLENFSGKQAATGLNFTLGVIKDGYNIIGLVNYVVPGSAAAEAGLKRGDVFVKINGKKLNRNNYLSMLEDDKYDITVAVNYDLNSHTWEGEKNYTIMGRELQENPIHFYKVIEEGNKKIGYLVMNAFRDNYNDELNEVFAEFKAKAVTDLILDLRYNGGGSLNTALALGQMITGQFTGSKYVSLEYNKKHVSENTYGVLSKNIGIYEFEDGQTKYVRSEPANSLKLNKIYVLTSGSTASASELTISCLKPFIDVVQIGETTYGKFVGSITLVDDPESNYTDFENRNTEHNYGLQPIVFAYYNANKQIFNKGLEPDKKIEYFDYFGKIKEFGNPSDPALAEALEEITGNKYRKGSEKENKNKVSFLGSTATMKKFGTELYITDLSNNQ